MSNKTIYSFSSNIVFILNNIFDFSTLPILTLWLEVTDIINFIKMNIKYHYNHKHQSLAMKVDNYMLLWLHHEYFISTIINKKLKQQYIEFFWIIDWIDWLVYKLDILSHWCIHLVFTVIQLKSCFLFLINLYNYFCSDKSSMMFVEDDMKKWKFFELE